VRLSRGRLAPYVAAAGVLLLLVGLVAGCAPGAKRPRVAARRRVIPPLAKSGKWYEPVLERADVARALAAASQAAAVPAGAAKGTTHLATESVTPVLKQYAADRSSGVQHSVAPSWIASSTAGSTAVLCSARTTGGHPRLPVWANLSASPRVRVGAFVGDRFMGEYTVYYNRADPPLSDISRNDGTYSLAERAALVLLWEHFGRGRFQYRVLSSDRMPGSWVVGRSGRRTAAVFLGDCSAPGSGATLDARVETRVKPGVVMGAARAAKVWYRVSRRNRPR
jgi:hypothetical protein